MSRNLIRIKMFLPFVLLIVGISMAKPAHFSDNQMAAPENDKGETMDLALMKALERYDSLRRLASDYDTGNLINDNYPIERLFRKQEIKRQGRNYRQCYFNPISCFRK